MEAIVLVTLVILWIVVIINLMLTLALVRKVNSMSQLGGLKQPSILDEGTEAPDFIVQNLEGEEVTQATYDDKERAMVFVSSSCGPCKDKMPELQELYPKAKKAGVELLIFNLDDIETTRAYVEELEFNVPIFAAPRGVNSLSKVYKIPGTPSYYIIDRRGKITSGGFLDEKWEKLKSKW